MKIHRVLFLLLCLPTSTEGQAKNASSIATAFTPKPTPLSFTNIAYTVEGLVACAGNLLIILAIATTKDLRRKELIIIAGLALAEFIYGFGFLTAGIRRGLLEVTGYTKHPSTPWHCMWVIHMPFFFTGSVLQSLMLVITSLDRLLAIKAPVWYWTQRNKYAYICLGVAGACTAIHGAVSVLGAYFKPTNPSVTLKCVTSMALPDWYLLPKFLIQAIGDWASVLLYILVVYFYREYGKNLPNEEMIQKHMKRQRKMTKTIGICVTITVATVCIGRLGKTVLYYIPNAVIPRQTKDDIGPMISVFMNINMLANVFVYSWLQQEIRAAIIRILTCGRVELKVDGPKTQAVKSRRHVRVAPQNSEV